jgi:hypothetical protein
MTVYKLTRDTTHYCYLDLPMQKILKRFAGQVPPKQMMHFYRHGLQLKPLWVGIDAQFTSVEGVTESDAAPDVTVWAHGTVVLSGAALSQLNVDESWGELLPVTTPKGTYWVVNLRNDIEPDTTQSRNVIEAGSVLDVERLVFDEPKLPADAPFKTAFDGYRGIFCTESLKEKIELAGCHGLLFSEDLTGGF